MKITNQEMLVIQAALSKLIGMELPVRTSIDIAMLGSIMDKQFEVYRTVRDKLMVDYKIKVNPSGSGDEINFTSELMGDDDGDTISLRKEALENFNNKFKELLLAEGDEFEPAKIHLPTDMNIKPEVLKPIMEFIDVTD